MVYLLAALMYSNLSSIGPKANELGTYELVGLSAYPEKQETKLLLICSLKYGFIENDP